MGNAGQLKIKGVQGKGLPVVSNTLLLESKLPRYTSNPGLGWTSEGRLVHHLAVRYNCFKPFPKEGTTFLCRKEI